MNENIYNNQEIILTPDKPWMVVVSRHNCYQLYGANFIKGDNVGLASSSGFDEFPKSNFANGAYIIDTSPIMESVIEVLEENGPVLDIALRPLTVRPLISEITFTSMFEAIQYPHTLDSMTAVSADVYAQVYRVIGALIGRWNGTEIVWEGYNPYQENTFLN